MNIGEFNRHLTLQHLVINNDDQGGYPQEFITYSAAWAKIEMSSAHLNDILEQEQPEIIHRIFIRYRKDFMTTDRLIYGERIFQMIAPPVNIKEQNMYLLLHCREVVS